MKSAVQAQLNRSSLLSLTTSALLIGVLAPSLSAAKPQAHSRANRNRATNRPTLQEIMDKMSTCMTGQHSNDSRAKVLYEALAQVFVEQACIEKISDTDSPSKTECVIEIENLSIEDNTLSTTIFVPGKDTSGQPRIFRRAVAEVDSNTTVADLRTKGGETTWGWVQTNDFDNTLACVEATSPAPAPAATLDQRVTALLGKYTQQEAVPGYTSIDSRCPTEAELEDAGDAKVKLKLVTGQVTTAFDAVEVAVETVNHHGLVRSNYGSYYYEAKGLTSKDNGRMLQFVAHKWQMQASSTLTVNVDYEYDSAFACRYSRPKKN